MADDRDASAFGIARRDLLGLGAGLSLAAASPASAAPDQAQAIMPGMDMPLPAGPRPKVAMLIYPKMVLMDLVGPLTVMTILRADVNLYWKDLSPVTTDVGLSVSATKRLEECPDDLDVLLVPGGIMGTIACMDDSDVTGFLAARGASARYVTSVCTGSLVLGAAGLLNGYRATSHWAVADLLPFMGAQHVDERVVRDRNRITAGGVTAGIDFGLSLAALLKGEEEARRIQLTLEYSPKPPFLNGTPQEAGAARVADARSRRVSIDQQARIAAIKAGKRLGVYARA